MGTLHFLRPAKNHPRLILVIHSSRRMDCLMLCLRCLERFTDLAKFKRIYILVEGYSPERLAIARHFERRHDNAAALDCMTGGPSGDAAMAAVIAHFVGEGAGTVTHTPDGIDLEGTVLSRGVHLEPGKVGLDDGWYSGYLRVATNEKGVVRSYFSAGHTGHGQRVESDTRRILGEQFGGNIIE